MERVKLHTVALTDNKAGPKSCVPRRLCKGTTSYGQGKVTDIRDKTEYNPEKRAAGEEQECLTVPLATLDELVPSGRVIELWHLDVEGAELAALRSARRLLAENRMRCARRIACRAAPAAGWCSLVAA